MNMASDSSHYLYKKTATHDSDEHAESLVQWDQTYDQVSPGAFVGELLEMWFKGLQVFRETTNRSVQQNGSSWEGCQIIGIPVAMSGPGLFARQQFSRDTLFTFPSEESFSLTTPEQFDVIGVAIPKAALDFLLAAGGDGDGEPLIPDTPAVLLPDRSKLDDLRQCLVSVLEPNNFEPTLLAYPQVQKTMHSAIIGHIVETLHSARAAPMPSPSFKARSHLVHQAIELALAHPDDPPSVEELCGSLKVSRRMLNYSFQETLGTSPVQYLRSLRLNAVRRDLRTAGAAAPSIRDIASRWGFWHLPRFAADYRALFGELPSATLKRHHRFN